MGHGLYSSFEARKCAHLRMTETVQVTQRHSSFTPASFTTLRQRATSAETIVAKAGPVTSGTSEPLRSQASLIGAVCMACCNSLTMRATIAGGVFLGANSPYQVATS